MIKMRKSQWLATAVFLTPMFAAAQSAPQIVITFDEINVAVPLGSWLPAVLAVIVIGAALVWRKRMGSALRSLMVAAAALLATASLVQIQDARAVSQPFPITLASSPSQTPITMNFGTATNATSRKIRLTSLSVIQEVQSSRSCPLQIVAANTTCNVGTELATGATCQINVECPF